MTSKKGLLPKLSCQILSNCIPLPFTSSEAMNNRVLKEDSCILIAALFLPYPITNFLYCTTVVLSVEWNRGGCSSGGIAGRPLITGLFPRSSCPHVEVSLGKTLLMVRPAPCMVARCVCVCVCEWVNERQIVKRFG